MNSGIIEDWIDYATECASADYKNSPDLRIVSLTLLTQIWLLYPLKIEESESKVNNIMNLFSKVNLKLFINTNEWPK